MRGADYGWNVREGHCATDSTTDCGPPPAVSPNPIFDYGRSNGCTRGHRRVRSCHKGVWPAQYERGYLFADFVCNKIFQLARDGSGAFSATEFASDVAVAVSAMTFGPPASPSGALLRHLGRRWLASAG